MYISKLNYKNFRVK